MEKVTVTKKEDGSLQTITIVTVWKGIIQDVSPFPFNKEGDEDAKKFFISKCPNCTEEEIDDNYRNGRYDNDDYEVIIYLT